MFKNYLKLAWRILGRRKFFTFISLFGISFTLGILMVTLSFLQSELGSNTPLSNKDDLVYISHSRLVKTFKDTIPKIDTVLENGITVYDTTYTYKDAGSSASQSPMSLNIADNYLNEMPSAKDRTMFNSSNFHDVYVNGVKVSLYMLLSDANYWSVFDHKMIEGRVFDEAEVSNAAQVIVISTKTAQNYFGREKDVVGEEMFIDGKTYKVIGLYPNKSKIIPFVSPDCVAPYTMQGPSKSDNFYFGAFNVIYVAKPGSIDKLKAEIDHAGTAVPMDHPDNDWNFEKLDFRPRTYNEMYAEGIYYQGNAEKSYSNMKMVLISLFLFFTILPTLNLINLNVSRIMDRSSEIGVRKAFGAHRGNIITQFIVENIVQTILGGLIGFVIAWILINIINNGGYLGNSVLAFNTKFFIYSFLATMLFGVLSGFLPAYRMSKLQIVNALKQKKL